VLALSSLARGTTLTRVDPRGARSVHAMPSRMVRVRDLDGRRMIAWSRDPVGHWESADGGRSWTPLAPSVEGRAAIDERAWSAHAHEVSAPSLLGRSPAAPPACTAYACVIDDALVYADPRWLAAPPQRAAREGALTRIEPTSDRDLPRPPIDAVWFCGAASDAHAAIRAARGSDEDGAPGANGWLSVAEHHGETRARWSFLEGGARRTRASRSTPLGPLSLDPARSHAASIEHRLRLATDAFALIERCADEGRCDLLLARRDGLVSVLVAVENFPAETTLHSARPLASGGLVLRLTGGGGRGRTGDPQRDVLLAFDRAGALIAWRAFAWRAGHWGARGLAFDGREVGLAVSSRWTPGAFTFFPLSGRPEAPFVAALSDASAPCRAIERGESAPWLLTSDPGYAPVVYVMGRPVAIERGGRARWTSEGGRLCLRELWIEPVDPSQDALWRTLGATIDVRAADGTLRAVLAGPAGAHRAPCIPR
jgi:hypothetical protein